MPFVVSFPETFRTYARTCTFHAIVASKRLVLGIHNSRAYRAFRRIIDVIFPIEELMK